MVPAAPDWLTYARGDQGIKEASGEERDALTDAGGRAGGGAADDAS